MWSKNADLISVCLNQNQQYVNLWLSLSL